MLSEEVILAGIGIVLPPFIDLVNRKISNTHWRFVIALVACILIGSLMAFLQYGQSVIENIGLIFVASQTIYKLWYEKSAIQERVRSL